MDVSDLGILAANYGTTNDATWPTGDFNEDGKVDVGDLGILAANYGTGTVGGLDFGRDARALGLSVEHQNVKAVQEKVDISPVNPFGCGELGLVLVTSVFLIGLRR